MTYMISKEIQFDAGHRVPLHASKCKNPHGHRYRVVVYLEGELILSGSEAGMVKDFGNVKDVLTAYVHDKYDHGFIVHRGDEALKNFLNDSLYKVIIMDEYPTAECLAAKIYYDIIPYLPNLIKVEVWETPTSMASYSYSDQPSKKLNILEQMS